MPSLQQSSAQAPAVEPGALDADHLFGTPVVDVPASRRSLRHLRAVPDVPLDFDAVVRSLTPRLQRYATRRIGNPHEAEELVQEALLRAYQHRAELRTEDDVAAWTTCVTGRLVIDRLRVRGRSTPYAEVPEGTRTARDTADVVVARDQARLALDALDAMPTRQAAVLWAREVEGLGYDEIGRRYGMTEPAVRSLLTRARKALRKEYAVRGGTMPGVGLALLAPWASGTGWLDRLRTGMERLTTPAALGVVGAGLVTGALVLPATSAPELVPAPAVTRSAAPQPPPAAAPAPPAPAAVPETADPQAGAAAPPARTAPVEPASSGGVLARTGLDDTCAAVAGAGAGGSGCAARDDDPVLSVALPVQPAQAGLDLPALSSDKIDCTRLPDLPLTQCTATPGER